MDQLRVRVYNVLFGDAILVSFPDAGPGGTTETRHMLIDVGNCPASKEGGADEVFKDVLKDVLSELDGHPLDLYVMTHEHLDHVQGLLCAERKFYTDGHDALKRKLHTRQAWLTASAEEGYYDSHPEARERHLQARAAYERITSFTEALRASPGGIPSWVEPLCMNNDYWKTGDCVDYLRTLTDAAHTNYVHRDFDPEGHHPFQEAKISIWAPEEDTSKYYGHFRPMLGLTRPELGRKQLDPAQVVPPRGVDAGAFYDLVKMTTGYAENLLAIDRAANNTSVVLCLEWRDWKLLFTGDAETRSWKEMEKARLTENAEVLEPVHFLKVSHHGSRTGLPPSHILERILPSQPPDDKPRRAVVSTCPNTYSGVPDRLLLQERLTPLCDLHYVERATVPDGEYQDFFFPS
jgi:beta-lactamase superfamily II metal-dependent hydrolase